MKFYPCIIMSKAELKEAGIGPVEFKNGQFDRGQENTKLKAIEDICGRPVVDVCQRVGKDEEIIVLIADGYVQNNRLTGKRTVVIIGEPDTLKVILTDIFEARPEEEPYEIFCSYSYQTGIDVQLQLQDWVRDEYKR